MTVKKCVVVVQARLGSTRLPKKILEPVGSSTMLEQIVRRCKAARTVEAVVVACPIGEDEEIFEKAGITCYPGSETDLVSRLTSAAKANQATHFVRVTGDCPFVCPRMIEHLSWNAMNIENARGAANWGKRTFPDGLDLDCWDVEWLLGKQWKDREYFAQEAVRECVNEIVSVENPRDLSRSYRLTVDWPEDLAMVRKVYEAMGNELWDSQSIISYLESHPRVRAMNAMRINGTFGERE